MHDALTIVLTTEWRAMDLASSPARVDAARSPEYRAALEAQLDYDSTTEGQRALTESIEATEGPVPSALRARLTAGRAARRFRKEQAAFMPPRVSASGPRAAAMRSLAGEREHLARTLAWAAAESEAWGTPRPATMESARLLDAAVRALDVEVRGSDALPFGLYAGTHATAPWAGGRTSEPDPADVAVLLLLGAEAAWLEGEIVLASGARAARAWGYVLEDDPAASARWFVVASPAIARWFAAEAKKATP